MARLKLKRRMKNLLMFLPNMIALCGRLITDKRVPAAEKALFAGAVIYALMPFDLIPDLIPFVGQIDDTYLIAMTLLRLISKTDVRVVRENWRGGGDIIQLAEAVAGLAPRFLPKRVLRVLSAKVKTVPEGLGGVVQAVRNSEPLLVEVPGEKKK
ncbi:MAG TPA: YkvA family protein [Pyrinomonadaceae bacterium]